MLRLDHVALNVSDVEEARDWYVSVLGLTVEFESQDPPVAGLKDEADFTIILTRQGPPTACSLYFQVDDVAGSYQEMTSRGVEFLHPPQANAWGYGPALSDPDGRLVGLWDERSMQAHRGD